jgi:hypothetical protein
VSKFLLITISDPFSLDNDIRELATNFDGSIGTKRVHDNNFVAPLNAFQAPANIFFLVEANDDG